MNMNRAVSHAPPPRAMSPPRMEEGGMMYAPVELPYGGMPQPAKLPPPQVMQAPQESYAMAPLITKGYDRMDDYAPIDGYASTASYAPPYVAGSSSELGGLSCKSMVTVAVLSGACGYLGGQLADAS